ncbi:YutD family protein [Paenibacillus sacheonensis]|uniref:DUF1027 domain-containing protein n=1 Tax=Paenibacillus sacheonensis TaxID=742054 RepID=A0A7X4YS91_9BACL|nr:YutD family protein [Paenibacillus sacheonensis]MBM7566956.1 uncharacterized protein YutD [Paenibacillus sacheonensis]NBC71578.1 DUF1027 domain-containing protein [Paenibacillus sacheonensis]
MIHISGRAYALIHENRNGWNLEAFRERYSDVLERYDYVVGDWGYNQLRLKGFFRDTHPKATRESVISTIADYINEYCNFGCAYFVLEKQPGGVKQGEDGEGGENTGEYEVIEVPDTAEEALLTASRTIAAAKAADAPVSENQHVKFMPRHERDLRREQQRNSRKETTKETDKERENAPRDNHQRKPSGKDRDHGARQGQQAGRGQQQERGERPERSERGERGSERPERQNRGERSDRGEQRGERPERQDRGEQRGDRPERSDRGRSKQRHFNPKAPVAAASEPNTQPRQQHQQHNRNKDAAPKQS